MPSKLHKAIAAALILAALPAAAQQPGCLIKGNISSKGERVCHPPGCKHYAATVIDPERGERWFCSEAEAASAGWRRTKVC